MAGAVFVPGEQKLRPGVYFRVINAGAPQQVGVAQGTVAALFRSSWGPLGLGQAFEGGAAAVNALYGTGGTVDVPRYAFQGQARRVLPVRLGTGGTSGTTTLVDTAAAPGVNVATITARYEGNRALTVTIRDSLADATKRELLVMDGTVQVQAPILFTKGGTSEVDALVAAVAAAGNASLVTATKLAPGAGTLKAVTQQALTGGADPAVTAGDYTTALALLDNQEWNVLVIDSEDAAVHATVAAYINRVQAEGMKVLAVLGEPTGVAFDTRATNAAAFNDEAVHYVGNGFRVATGDLEGVEAAAWVGGLLASGPVKKSFTHEVIQGATAVVGGLAGPQIDKALQSGMLVFTKNKSGQVQIEKGINTLVTPAANQDAGWKKIRRTRTRFELMDRIAATWDPLVGKVDNNTDGRAALIQAAQGIVNAMVGEGALISGLVIEDPANPPTGDEAYFLISVVDLDSAEVIKATFGFQFSA